MEIALRKVAHKDYSWLFELHVATMKEYIEQVHSWDDDQQRQLFFYDFKPGRLKIITLNEADAGLIEIDREREGYYLRRLEIHPDFQNLGIGKTVVGNLIKEADHYRQRLWLTVLKVNPKAKRFYERLGFQELEELTSHYKMVHLGNPIN